MVAIGPGLAVKASAPYWFDLVRYEKRLLTAALSMVGGFLWPVWGRRPQLLGVAPGRASALGEATVLTGGLPRRRLRQCLVVEPEVVGVEGT